MHLGCQIVFVVIPALDWWTRRFGSMIFGYDKLIGDDHVVLGVSGVVTAHRDKLLVSHGLTLAPRTWHDAKLVVFD